MNETWTEQHDRIVPREPNLSCRASMMFWGNVFGFGGGGEAGGIGPTPGESFPFGGVFGVNGFGFFVFGAGEGF